MDYCAYLYSEIATALKNFNFSFEVLYLEIDSPFKIGNVQFEYLTPDFFDKQEKKKRETNPDYNMSSLRTKYQGRVYASCIVSNSERQRAKEIAFEECCISVDVLKLFSPTVSVPDYHIYFDIDRRVTKKEHSESIVRNPDDEYDLHFDLSRESTHCKFTKQHIEPMQKAILNFAYLITLQNKNELQSLIINSLNRYSEAISNRNIHKRIADLFTIWESLLLKDANTSIIQSVSLYGSKLLKKSVQDRKNLISFLKEMYEVRSAMIHHAISKELDMSKVSKFQIETVQLMETLIHHSRKHSTKLSLLEEIDNAIHQAY